MSSAALARAAQETCFHCDLPIPFGTRCGADIDGAWRAMCCPGCQAVAETIAQEGLEGYYQHREIAAERASEDAPAALEAFDDAEVQRDFVTHEAGDAIATFSIEGMRCAACAWLIERHLARVDGVRGADVSLASHRVLVRHDPQRLRVSDLLRAVRAIGYTALPFEPDREAQLREREQRAAWVRLGVSGLGTMQVMMFAVGLYAGALDGIEPVYRALLRWTSLLVATFVVTIGARPFFEAAWRDLRSRQLGMDVPVALAIGIAYVASAFATFAGAGEVYFDSVCMFTFFLSLGRILEQRARDASASQVRALGRRVPAVAMRQEGDGWHPVPVRALRPGDCVRVRPGECIPADGRVVAGESSVSEALWTGEDAPLEKRAGDRLIGGSTNLRASLEIEVLQAPGQGTLASIRRLLDRAQAEKPAVARLADRISRVFVSAVLVIAAATAAVWWAISPGDALWVTLSVLVATCPCALSLATPAALAAATGALAERGFLVTRGHTLETLARATRFAFDKTGTLTADQLTLGDVVILDPRAGDRSDVLSLAARLEGDCVHPIARALVSADVPARRRSDGPARIEATEVHPGAGVSAQVDGQTTRLGRADWVARIAPFASLPRRDGEGSWILLGDDGGPLAWISLRSQLREGAAQALARLRELGAETTLVSGDPSRGEVDRVARALGIDERRSGASPGEKVAVLHSGPVAGEIVAAVGDGVNDAPMLAGAEVSIAMAGGSDLARTSADAVLLGDRLEVLPEAVALARRTRSVIRQNLIWAAAYNALVLPLAVTGQLPPYLAAIGMSASSLVVVGNALRLRSGRERERA